MSSHVTTTVRLIPDTSGVWRLSCNPNIALGQESSQRQAEGVFSPAEIPRRGVCGNVTAVLLPFRALPGWGQCLVIAYLLSGAFYQRRLDDSTHYIRAQKL